MISLSYEEAVSLLNRAVAEKGADYIYNTGGRTCEYFDPESGAPSCIVGHVLAYKGLQYRDIHDLVGRWGLANSGWSAEDLVEGGVFVADRATALLLGVAQSQQDGGVSWGSAVQTAIKDAR